MTLGDKIKGLLKEYGWSQRDLAKKTGIPRPTITAIANNKYKKVNLDNLFRIARAFEIPPERLLVAAGYVSETKAVYDSKETPEKVLNNIKINVRRLEKMLQEKNRKE